MESFLPHHGAGGRWLVQAPLSQRRPIQAQTPHLEVIVSRGSSTRVPASCFIFWREPLSLKPLRTGIKTDRHATKRERQFLTMHINRLFALANYRTLINCIIWLYQCHSPLIHNLATVRACWITFNMPWRSRFVAFLQQEQFCQKNLHAHTPATNRWPNNAHSPLWPPLTITIKQPWWPRRTWWAIVGQSR